MKGRSKGLSVSYVYYALNTVASVFLFAFVVRVLGQTDFGVYQTMTAFVSYLVLLEFGVGTIMTRNVSLCSKDGSDDENLKRNVSTIWALSVALTVIIAAVAVVFYLLIDSIYANSLNAAQITAGKKIFIFAAVSLIFTFSTQTLNGLIIGYEHYSFEKTVLTVKLLMRIILFVIALLITPNVVLIAVIDCALSVLAFAATLLFSVKKIKVKLTFAYFDVKILRIIAPLCFAMLLQTVINTANGSVDKFLIGILTNPDEVAVYAVAMSLFTLFSAMATIPVTMYMPQVAKNMKSGMEGRELTESLVPACRLNVLITGITAFGVFAVGKQFITVFFGAEFEQAWLYSLIIIFPTFFFMTNGVVTNVADVLRKRHVISLITLAATMLNVIFTYFAIIRVGAVGAAAATGFFLIVQTVALNVYYSKKMRLASAYLFFASYKGILPYLIIASVPAYCVKFVVADALVQFVVGGLAFLAVFGVCFAFFGANAAEKTLIKNIFRKILRKDKTTRP